ncbi:uncharacterized protein erich1 [Centroberyx gerrardi]
MTHRKQVFQSKVLQKLYPTAPKQEKEPSPLRIVETLAKKPFVKRKVSQDAAIGDGGTARSAAHPGRRVYTALPPPTGYKTGAEGSVTLPQPGSVNSAEDPAEESTPESSEELDGERGAEEQKRRRRRRKRKLTLHEHPLKDGEAPASEASAGQSQARADEGGERLSRNKRRKLKKKRHKEKLLSMGLVPRAAALEFTYQKEEDEEVEEEEEENESRAAEVSDFLRTTMEIYMSDRSRLHADRLPLLSVAVDDLLSSMASGSVPTSVLRQLHSLKAFVQQKQTDRLAKALEELHHTSSMSPEETAAVASLFQYWITDILPMQGDTETGPSTTQPQDCQSD